MRADYRAFLESKAIAAEPHGFEPKSMRPHMTGHWRAATETAIRRGRCGLFLSTGLGKTSCELEAAEQFAEHTGKPTLILTPLAVAAQIGREADRFGYSASVMREGVWAEPDRPILIANYDRLDEIDVGRLGAVVLDESSVLKNLAGRTSRALIERMSVLPYRLAATATPAPNDHTELGQHASFLGVMSAAEMLARWFVNDTATASQKWRLKGHAVASFWDWVASWAVMAETPEDLGFDGSAFELPPLKIHRHRAAGDHRKPIGGLFGDDVSATTMFAVKRETSSARAAAVADLIAREPDETWIVWCDTDDEASHLKALLPEWFEEVRGSHSAARKESVLGAFTGGTVRGLITKPSVAGAGLNMQRCARVAFVGRSFSYELWYQAVRRCWRYGQTRPVEVHLIVAEGEDQIGRVIDQKAEGHSEMQRAMRAAQRRNTSKASVRRVCYTPTYKGSIPSWIV